ncbi:hypothetical protein CP965_05195 [Halarcobacter mediterraneus]|uniref:Uncharacterized protein n=1 Tax=Halarcobacter mediterraneus TaxID=2023153 RepID=A0A4Q1B327_9BACT|nr:hypothetical protein [Halarcobacter mediterraneus]RXK13195.1 hypothetical protein CP965_05195 [Halarcobacter mediterraneus]
MELFFKLEAGYLAISFFILVVTLIVTTRPFIAKGVWKRSSIIVGAVLSLLVVTHYSITSSRINEVEKTFNEGKKVICESKAIRKVAQSIIIEKENGWDLNSHMFSSPNYSRDFFSARCIKYIPIDIQE